MKKAAAVSVLLIMTLSTFGGCRREEVEKAIAPLVADVQEENGTAQEEAEETPDIPEIDAALPIEAGSWIAVVSKSTKGQFWDQVKKGMEDAVQAVNVAYGYEKDEQITMTFEGPSDERDVEGQINTIDAVVAENPAVLCISAGDMDSCQAQLETARENGIPVIVFDSAVTESKLTRAYRGSDNTYIGELAAYKLGRAMGKMGKVAVFSAQEKTSSAKERVEGFLSNISNYTDIQVVEVVYQDQVEDMTAAMQEVLDKYPQLDGVFCTNADVSELYLDMEKNEEEAGIPAMVGVDATSRQVEAVKNGEEIGIVSQNAYAMGYQTMWAAIRSTAPKKKVKVERELLLSPAWIELSNIDNPDYGNYIY